MSAERQTSGEQLGETVPLHKGGDITQAAWLSAVEEMKSEYPALRECFPEGVGFGDLWRFREHWALDDQRGRASAVVAAGWVAWEFCGLGAWLTACVHGEALDEGSRTVAWRWRLGRQFWDDLLVAAVPARCEAWGSLAGGDEDEWTAPPLEEGMVSTQRGMLVELSDLWLRRLAWMEGRERAAAAVPGAHERAGELVCARHEIEALKREMLADLRRVLAFETNPAHWEPTPGQLALLPLVWRRRFEFKEALSRYIGTRRNPPAEVADARTALALLRTEMAAAADGPRTAR
ncbi:MAG: hypothetical protein ABW221_15590 [Vicinamibacteria bacterium]